MSENEVKTINIPIDEYFDLRTRAEMNGILMERLVGIIMGAKAHQ